MQEGSKVKQKLVRSVVRSGHLLQATLGGVKHNQITLSVLSKCLGRQLLGWLAAQACSVAATPGVGRHLT
uniref:Uncharacterized protein n=1 Tax=Oryza punctata TaxID=4537 RepID=A0A0E0JZM3_ORYPU